MARYKEIKKRIHEKFNSVPKNQQIVGEYIINNLDEIPFLNIQELSQATNVSVASIVRFAQAIGFSGFNELRAEIASSLKSQLNNKEIFPLFEKHKTKEDLLTEVANVDITNINSTLNLIDRKVFDDVIESINSADRVFTAGLGISYLLAEILAYQLTQVGIDSSTFKHTHTLFHEQVLFMKPKDLLIVFSFPPYSKETVDVAQFASKRGFDVIAVTNMHASPVTFFTKANLIVKSDNMLFTNSFAAISVLINAIATASAVRKRSRANKILKETEKIMVDQNQIIIGSKK